MGRIIITIILVTSMCLPSHGQVHDLSQYQWKHRLIILSAADNQDETIAEQLSVFKTLADDLDDRKLLIVIVSASGTYLQYSDGKFQQSQLDRSLHNFNSFSDDSTDFSITLIGLDGGVKLKQSKMVLPKDLYQLIDRMPMRRAEMLGKKW